MSWHQPNAGATSSDYYGHGAPPPPPGADAYAGMRAASYGSGPSGAREKGENAGKGGGKG